MTEKELIKQWSKSRFLLESISDDYIKFFNDYVESHNYKLGFIYKSSHEKTPETRYFTANELNKIKYFDDIEEAIQEIKHGFIYDMLVERREEDLNDNPDLEEFYGVKYHDDSDYDREYGYGPAGHYDETQLSELAERFVDEDVNEIIEGFEYTYSDFTNQTKYTDLVEFLTHGYMCYVNGNKFAVIIACDADTKYNIVITNI